MRFARGLAIALAFLVGLFQLISPHPVSQAVHHVHPMPSVTMVKMAYADQVDTAYDFAQVVGYKQSSFVMSSPPTTTTTSPPVVRETPSAPRAHVATAPVTTTTTPTTASSSMPQYGGPAQEDATQFFPGPGDPMFGLPPSVQAVFACIRGVESHSHLNSYNPSSQASGLYGFLPSTWAEYGGTRWTPQAYQATGWEQDYVAAHYYIVNVGGKPVVAPSGIGFYAWGSDGCV